LISGCPIPQVYINIINEGKGKDRKTIYEVVDGQQRLRAILEFMDDKYSLVKTAAKAYPVSDLYIPHIGRKFSELPESLQGAIWNYPLAVQELREWDEREIRALFRRLNYVVERLNKQELRHSQYFGEFMDAVEKLSNNPFWDETNFFSRRDSQRMKDIEFISELFVIAIDGIQDQQSTLDRFYADYDVVFPNRHKFVAKFNQVIESLRSISDFIQETRFSKKADFYGLFAATLRMNERTNKPVNLSKAKPTLKKLSNELEKDPEELTGIAAKYYPTVIEGPNKAPKRKVRAEILWDILKKHAA
jgi:hypothetical protein